MEQAESWAEGVTSLFKVLSKPNALIIFRHTVDGIKSSTYAIEELDLTPKRYYARLRELVDIGLVRKLDSGYGQTALGKLIYDRFLPAMIKAVDAKDELEFIMGLEGIEIEKGVRDAGLKMLTGHPGSMINDTGYLIDLDRESAIHSAITVACEEDTVLIAGKGHEDYQIIGREKRAFDDRRKAEAVLRGAGGGFVG